MKRCVVHALQRMFSILWTIVLIASVVIDGVAIAMFVVLPAEAESIEHRYVEVVTIDGSGESQTETEDDDANTDETYPAVEFPQKPHPTVTEDETEVAETVVPEVAEEAETTETTETSETAEAGYPSLEDITQYSSTEDRIRALMGFFVNEGFTPEAAAGIAGNIAIESSYDTTANNSNRYFGLCQWNTLAGGGYWWYAVEEYLLANGYSWNSFEGQVKAVLYCENRGMLSDKWLEELKGLKNIEQAVELFTVYYEGASNGDSVTRWYNPGMLYQGLGPRTAEAYEAYRVFMDPVTTYSGNKPYSPYIVY